MNNYIKVHIGLVSPSGIFRLGKNNFIPFLLVATCAGGEETRGLKHLSVDTTGTGNSPVSEQTAGTKTINYILIMK